MHSFCTPCLDSYIESRPLELHADNWTIVCPNCRQQTVWTDEKDVCEISHNNLLSTLQATTRKYRCLFCPQTLVKSDLKTHLEVCAHRKFICNQGCDRVFCRQEIHASMRDCLSFVDTENRTFKRKVEITKDIIRKRDQEVESLKEKVRTTEARFTDKIRKRDQEVESLEEKVRTLEARFKELELEELVDVSKSETGGGGGKPSPPRKKRGRKAT